jgi:hypothetical protein
MNNLCFLGGMEHLRAQVTSFITVDTNKKPFDTLRVKLLLGQAESAAAELHTLTKEEKKKSYISIDYHDGSNFHLGHYLVMCDSFLLFEVFKEWGGWDWPTPILPIHLAMMVNNRAHWIPRLLPLSGKHVHKFGCDGLNPVQWAIKYHCPLGPLIQYHLWPQDQSFAQLHEYAQQQQNEQAVSLLRLLI